MSFFLLFLFASLQFAGGRYDFLKKYEDEFDMRSQAQKKLFHIYFLAWQEHQFVIETLAGAHLEFNAPTILGILLDASNINFFALSPLGCFTFAGKSILNGRAIVGIYSQGYAKFVFWLFLLFIVF